MSVPPYENCKYLYGCYDAFRQIQSQGQRPHTAPATQDLLGMEQVTYETRY